MKHALLTVVLVLAGASLLFAQEGDDAPENGSDGEENSTSQSVDESTLTFDDSQEESRDAQVDGEGLRSFGAGDFLRMVLVLGLVVLSIYVLFYFLKKAGGQGQRSDRTLRILGTTTLQGSRAVHLLEVGGRVYLVGSAEQSVNLLSEITDRETIDQLLLDHGVAGEAGVAHGRRSFSDLVGDMFRGAIPAQGKPVHSSMTGTDSAAQTQAADTTQGYGAGNDSGTASEQTPPEGANSDTSFVSRQRARLHHL